MLRNWSFRAAVRLLHKYFSCAKEENPNCPPAAHNACRYRCCVSTRSNTITTHAARITTCENGPRSQCAVVALQPYLMLTSSTEPALIKVLVM